ncbi:thioredoxin family protein [Flaviaesturariibacter terrae]
MRYGFFFPAFFVATAAVAQSQHPVAVVKSVAIARKVPQADAPPTAAEVLKEARAVAAKEHKNVLILFHASWCGWCHKMQKAMEEPDMKLLFEKSFVIRWLDVYEQPPKKALENPGAEDLLKQYKGNDLGIPYFLLFDARGNKLADSQKAPGQNIGCPAEEDEVAFFVEVLKKTTKLTPDELQLIAGRFKKNKG